MSRRALTDWSVLKMAKKKKIKKLIKEITKNNHPVKSRPINISKKDLQKKHKKRKPIETGFICDDFEILI